MPKYYGFFLVPGVSIARVCSVEVAEEKPTDSEEYMWALVTEELECVSMGSITATIVDGALVVNVDDEYVSATKDAVLRALREQRSKLMQSCDWTQANDSPLSDEAKTAWATYRQALRDLPSSLTYKNYLGEPVQYPEPPTPAPIYTGAL